MKFRPKISAEALAADFSGATRRAGRVFPLVSEQDYRRRVGPCGSCQWARITDGVRYCDHPKRECATLCAFFHSETCPLNLWPTMEAQPIPVRPARRLISREEFASRRSRIENGVAQIDAAIASVERSLASLRQRRAQVVARLAAIPSPVIGASPHPDDGRRIEGEHGPGV